MLKNIKQEQLKSIRELCNYIIYQTYAYVNDGNDKRLDLIDMDLINIKELTYKIKTLK